MTTAPRIDPTMTAYVATFVLPDRREFVVPGLHYTRIAPNILNGRPRLDAFVIATIAGAQCEWRERPIAIHQGRVAVDFGLYVAARLPHPKLSELTVWFVTGPEVEAATKKVMGAKRRLTKPHRNSKGATLTCASCGSRLRRDTARSPCPFCGTAASAGDV